MPGAMDSRRSMRLSIGGCVAVSFVFKVAWRCPGYAMQTVDIDGMRSKASMRESVEILCNADANDNGSRVICAPVASAEYSRLRDIAIRNSGLIIKLNTMNANHTMNNIAPELLRSLLDELLRVYVRLRPKMSAINTVTPTPVISNMSNRISRLAKWAIS